MLEQIFEGWQYFPICLPIKYFFTYTLKQKLFKHTRGFEIKASESYQIEG